MSTHTWFYLTHLQNHVSRRPRQTVLAQCHKISASSKPSVYTLQEGEKRYILTIYFRQRFGTDFMDKTLYPSRRYLKVLFFVILWMVLPAASSRSRHSNGAMLSFICACGVIMSAISFIPGAAWLKL